MIVAMKCLHISILVCCLAGQSVLAYYTVDQLEQIEQKYESPAESDDQEYVSNANQAATIETLNQAFSQLEPAQVKSYGESSNAAGIPQSLLSSPSNYDSSSLNSPLKSLEGKSSEYSKVTQIPTGSVFSMPDKGAGSLEFQSPFSKQPYSIVFRTHSMPVKIKQQHQTLPAPEVEFVRSQEEVHRIKHEVVRPVIQEVHEIIQPYRRVIQEIKPVQEEIQTIISKGDSRGGRKQEGGTGLGNVAAGPGLGAGLGAGGLGAGGLGAGGFGAGAGIGGGGGGGLSMGYSENVPRFAYPQQYRGQMGPSHHGVQAHYPIAHQFSALSRGPSHSRY